MSLRLHPSNPKYIRTNAYVSYPTSANLTLRVPHNPKNSDPTHTEFRVQDHFRCLLDHTECLAEIHHHQMSRRRHLPSSIGQLLSDSPRTLPQARGLVILHASSIQCIFIFILKKFMLVLLIGSSLPFLTDFSNYWLEVFPPLLSRIGAFWADSTSFSVSGSCRVSFTQYFMSSS